MTQLKGPDADECGSSVPVTTSTLATAAAYHLVSTVPVIVTQFNALEYEGAGGPAGKDWSTCPGDQPCTDMNSPNYGPPVGCFSFTNDASLLLPSTALTGNSRVVAYPGETASNGTMSLPYMSGTLTITGVADGTHVKVLRLPVRGHHGGNGDRRHRGRRRARSDARRGRRRRSW